MQFEFVPQEPPSPQERLEGMKRSRTIAEQALTHVKQAKQSLRELHLLGFSNNPRERRAFNQLTLLQADLERFLDSPFEP